MTHDLTEFYSVLEKAGKRDIESIEAFWSNDFSEASKTVLKFTGELDKLDHQKIGYLSTFFRISIGEVELENDLKVKIHTFLLYTFIKWLNEHSEDSYSYVEKIASEFKLCVESEKFFYSALDKAFQTILNCIDTGANIHPEVFNIFSQLLISVQSSQEIFSTENYSSVKGGDFFDEIFLSLCTSTNWSANHIVPLVHCLCDLTLSSKHLEQISEKIQTSWDNLENEAIPPFVYQLLLLSYKGSRNTFISQIIQYFNSYHKETNEEESTLSNDSCRSKSQLSQIEGTVIVHIFEATRNEKELGTYIINLFKGAKLAYLSPFTLGLLLALTRNSAYQLKATEYLKNCVLAYYQNHQSYIAFSRKCFELSDIKGLFSTLISRCQYGSDLVVQGLVEFLMEILDTQVRVFGKVIDTSKKITRIDSKTPLESAQFLAEEILLEVFKAFEVFQQGIFDQLLSRMDSNTDTTFHHVSLLKKIIHSSLFQLGQITTKIKNTIPTLTSLPLPTSKTVVEAWSPLICQNPSFLDMLMMVLKKGLFIKKSNERLVSLSGLLFIFHLAAQSKIASRGQADKEINPLCLEILGILRRCLGQQAEIRLSLYEGLNSIVQSVPSVAPHIAEFLSQQAFKYYNQNEQVSNPLHLTDCFNSQVNSGTIVSEPLPSLFSTLITSVICSIRSGNSVSRYLKVLSALSNRIISSDLDDFGLSETTSFDQVSQEGLTNNATASILLGLYENFMHFSETEKDENMRLATILKLFEKHSEAFQLVKSRALDPRGRPVIKHGISCTYLPLSSALSLLQIITRPGNSLPSLPRLKLIHYSIEVFSIYANTIQSEFSKELSQATIYYEIFSTLSFLILIPTDNNIEIEPATAQAGLNCLNKLVDMFLAFDLDFESNFSQALKKICPKISSEEITSFEDITLWFITEIMALSNKPTCGYVTSILELVSILLKVLNQKSQETFSTDYYQQELMQLEKKIGTELRHIEKADPVLARSILRLYLLYGSLKNDFTIFYKFIGAIQIEQGVIGNEDSDNESENNNDIYSRLGHLITKNLVHPYLSVVFPHIRERLDKFSWAISYISGYHELDQNITFFIRRLQSSPIIIEKAICKEFSVYVKALGLLVKTTLLGSSIEQLLDILNHTYKILKQFSQHKIKHGLTRSDSFIPLMELVENNLTRHVFSFLTYAQAISAQSLTSGPPKKSRKVKQGEKISSRPTDKGSTKEIRMLSNLTLNLESFELHLYQLYSKFKINRKTHFKRSIARDFRIDKEIFLRAPTPEDDIEDLKALEQHAIETEELLSALNNTQAQEVQNSQRNMENTTNSTRNRISEVEELPNEIHDIQSESNHSEVQSENEMVNPEQPSDNYDSENDVRLDDSDIESVHSDNSITTRRPRSIKTVRVVLSSPPPESDQGQDQYDSEMIDDD